MTPDAIRTFWGDFSTELKETLRAAGGTAVITMNESASGAALVDLEKALQAELDGSHRQLLEMSDGIVVVCTMPDEPLPYVVKLLSVEQIARASPDLKEFVPFAISADTLMAYDKRAKPDDGARQRVAGFDSDNELLDYTPWTFSSWLSSLPVRVDRYVAICRSPGGLGTYLENWTESEDEPFPL